uniref:Uncharacterized protein n=1 Tax=Arundo donax TaxID=35708 RepID=A0A0A9CKN3_ARUDO
MACTRAATSRSRTASKRWDRAALRTCSEQRRRTWRQCSPWGAKTRSRKP